MLSELQRRASIPLLQAGYPSAGRPAIGPKEPHFSDAVLHSLVNSLTPLTAIALPGLLLLSLNHLLADEVTASEGPRVAETRLCTECRPIDSLYQLEGVKRDAGPPGLGLVKYATPCISPSQLVSEFQS